MATKSIKTVRPEPNKQINIQGAESILDKETPVWKFEYFDTTHSEWGFGTVDWEDILKKLASFEQLTWYKIKTATTGTYPPKTKNHFISVDRICSDAQKLFEGLKLPEKGYDEVFSLRLDGTHRLFGVVSGKVFYLLWNDPEHKICPTEAK